MSDFAKFDNSVEQTLPVDKFIPDFRHALELRYGVPVDGARQNSHIIIFEIPDPAIGLFVKLMQFTIFSDVHGIFFENARSYEHTRAKIQAFHMRRQRRMLSIN